MAVTGHYCVWSVFGVHCGPGDFVSLTPVILIATSVECTIVMSTCRGGNHGTARLGNWP